MRLNRSLAAGLIVGLTLAGCASKNSNHTNATGNGPPPAVSAAQPTCAVAPAAVVNAALGTDAGEPEETVSDTVTDCSYGGSGSVALRFETHMDANGFAIGRGVFEDNGQHTTDVSGAFDQGYTSNVGGLTTLVARKASLEIEVIAKASVEAEKALVQQLFAKL